MDYGWHSFHRYDKYYRELFMLRVHYTRTLTLSIYFSCFLGLTASLGIGRHVLFAPWLVTPEPEPLEFDTNSVTVGERVGDRHHRRGDEQVMIRDKIMGSLTQ
jgi:hypothetical protein